MQRARAEAPAGKPHVTVLLVDQADFGAAPSHPESARFDDARRASPIFRPSPTLFRSVDLGHQTKREPRQEIHPRTKCPRWCPACKMTNQKQLRRTIVFSSHSSEPMVDECRLPDTGPGNNCNDIDILVCPCTIQESDILLPTKNIASCNGQSGY